MRQRVMIAMALALKPDVIIADEPTTALDVTVQAQVMQLLADLQQEMKLGLILITHDMGVVADVADKICVMYAGNAVEQADVYQIYETPGPPLHQGAARVDPARRPEGPGADRHQGPAAGAGQPAARLLLPPRAAPSRATGARPTSRSSTPCPAAAPARATTGRRSWASEHRDRTGPGTDARRGPTPRSCSRSATSRSTSPSPRGSSSSAPSATSRPSTASRSTSTRARPSASSASPAAASRPSAGC